MKTLVPLLYIFFEIFTSCSTESVDVNGTSVVGVWKLTTWTVGIPLDLNNDSIFSTNLIEEISCETMETLTFSNNGTVASNTTFNPNVLISLDEVSSDYIYQVECDTEGSIGYTTSYEHKEGRVFINENKAVVNGNSLTMIYTNAQKILNLAKTDVLEAKDIILIYTRQ